MVKKGSVRLDVVPVEDISVTETQFTREALELALSGIPINPPT